MIIFSGWEREECESKVLAHARLTQSLRSTLSGGPQFSTLTEHKTSIKLDLVLALVCRASALPLLASATGTPIESIIK